MQLIGLLASLVLTGSADDLAQVKVEGMKLRVPATWTQKVEEGTYHYRAPSEDGAFELSVYTIPPRSPRQCMDQLLAALGGKDGWKQVFVGGAPAALKIVTDKSKLKSDAFATHTYLGCNGHYKWVLTFSLQQTKKQRYEPLAQEVVESIEYPKSKS